MYTRKILNLDTIKIKNVCSSKAIIKRLKRQAAAWKKMFTNHMSDKGLLAVYRELLNLSNKKTNPSQKNG